MTGVVPRKRGGRRSLNAKYDRLVGVSLRPHTRSRTIAAERNEERERLMARISGGGADETQHRAAAAPTAAVGPAAHRNKGTSRPPGGEMGKVAEHEAVQFPAGPYSQQQQQQPLQYQPLRRSALRSWPDPTPQWAQDVMHDDEEPLQVVEEDMRPATHPAAQLVSRPAPQPQRHQAHQQPPPLPAHDQPRWPPWQGFPPYGMNSWPHPLPPLPPLPPPQATPMPLFLTPHGIFTHSGQPVIVTDMYGVGEGAMTSPFKRGPSEYYPEPGMAYAYQHLPAYRQMTWGPRPPLTKRRLSQDALDAWEEAPAAKHKRSLHHQDEEDETQHRKASLHREDERHREPQEHQPHRVVQPDPQDRSTAVYRRPPTDERNSQEAKGPTAPFAAFNDDEDSHDDDELGTPPGPPPPQHSDHQAPRSTGPAPAPVPSTEGPVFVDDPAAADYQAAPSPTPSGSLYSYKTDSIATDSGDHGPPSQTLKPKRNQNAIASRPALSQPGGPSQPRTNALSQHEPNNDGNDTMAMNRGSATHAPLLQRVDSRPRYASDSARYDAVGGRKKSWFGSMSRLSYSARARDSQNRALLLGGSPPSSPSPMRPASMLPGASSSPRAPSSPVSMGRPATPTTVQTTSSRLQRASERAWAALAGLQPRMNGYDAVPVPHTIPAPPSPALGPVGVGASEAGSEGESSDSIEAFSDTQPEPAEPVPETSKQLPSLPTETSNLSLDEDDGIQPVELGPPRYKKVRFDLQEGDRLLNTLHADPGFKVWRDGY